MNRFGSLTVRWSMAVAAFAAGGSSVGCGGGGGGVGSGDTLQSVVLVDFIQAGEDNVPLNRVLEFDFSSPLNPNTIGPASIQIRQGPAFGAAVFGKYIVQGSRVFFEPQLPGLCDLSDGGFKPDTDYRVTVIGRPEEFAVRNLTGDPLQSTVTQGLTFHTRKTTDPQLFEDQNPAAQPSVVSVTPANNSPAVAVDATNKAVIVFSENLDPCSVSALNVTIKQYAVGPFSPLTDLTPSDPTTWGSGTPTIPNRTIRCTYALVQDTLQTVLTLTPIFGEWPDNALIVVSLSSGIVDFGGTPLVPVTFSFTTEDRIAQTKTKVMEFNGDVSIDLNQSTAEVNTTRALSRVQGFLLVAGDGDNGTNTDALTAPKLNGPDAALGNVVGGGPCNVATNPSPPVPQNDGNPDDFDPLVDINLSTGNTRNTCKNSTDGSSAVVFEYRSFRIRNGVTVRLAGVNPAIILVRGDINIESGGRLFARSDGGNGLTSGAGVTGTAANGTTDSPGGVGYAGGGAGGIGKNASSNIIVYGGNGFPGYGSLNYGLGTLTYPVGAPGSGGPSDPILQGAGRGNVGVNMNAGATTNRIAPSGGGGGHAVAPGLTGGATAGTANGNGTSPRALMSSNTDGAAGGAFGNTNGKMFTPEAGAGGGGGGTQIPYPFTTGFYFGAGGGGGAGGGFVDLTSQANIRIFGTVDAAGSRGGNGGAPGGVFYGSGGGGGGGSGGGIRLLTPGNVVLGTGAILTTAGGTGGSSAANAAGGANANLGGNGGWGRIAIEDSDSVIQGYGGAAVTPSDGSSGFYRGLFDPTRFQGGGVRPYAITNLIDIGPFAPTFNPVAHPAPVAADFIAGVPGISSRGTTKTSIFIEAEGFPAKADGTADLTQGTGWRSVGYFTDSGSETTPNWVAGATPPPVGDLTFPGVLPGNVAPAGIAQLNGREFVRFRFTFYLPSTMGPFDPGPYIDRWTLFFSYDQ